MSETEEEAIVTSEMDNAEEPTGADPNGTTDVATGETETVPRVIATEPQDAPEALVEESIQEPAPRQEEVPEEPQLTSEGTPTEDETDTAPERSQDAPGEAQTEQVQGPTSEPESPPTDTVEPQVEPGIIGWNTDVVTDIVLADNFKKFLKLMKAASKMLVNVNLVFDETGFSIKSMDAANVALMKLWMNASEFQSYNVSAPFKISIDMRMLMGLIGKLKAPRIDTFSFSFSPGLIIFNITGKTNRTMDMPVLAEDILINEPELTFTAFMEMPLAVYKEATEAMKALGDSCELLITPEAAKISCADDLRRSELSLSEECSWNVTAGQASSKYSTDYLEKFETGLSTFSQVKIELSNNYPCRVSSEDDGSGIIYILAPRVDSG